MGEIYAIAAVSGGSAALLSDSTPLRIGIATTIYGLLAWATGRLERNDLQLARIIFGK
jgi:hypothetical protein